MYPYINFKNHIPYSLIKAHKCKYPVFKDLTTKKTKALNRFIKQKNTLKKKQNYLKKKKDLRILIDKLKEISNSQSNETHINSDPYLAKEQFLNSFKNISIEERLKIFTDSKNKQLNKSIGRFAEYLTSKYIKCVKCSGNLVELPKNFKLELPFLDLICIKCCKQYEVKIIKNHQILMSYSTLQKIANGKFKPPYVICVDFKDNISFHLYSTLHISYSCNKKYNSISEHDFENKRIEVPLIPIEPTFKI